MFGQMLPLVAITEAINAPLGLLGGADPTNLDNFFAAFQPVSGGTIVEQEIARYPFANQIVAANAVIGQPLHISMLMVCPARGKLGYFEKLAVIQALQAAIVVHNNLGGTYIVATPSYIYPNCVFRRMSDVSSGASKQPQSAWLLEFEQPLIALTQGGIIASQSSLMQALSGLVQITSTVGGGVSWSGAAASIGPGTAAGPLASPALGPIQGVPSTIITTPLPPIPGTTVLPQ